jgi:hypothetical protein
LDDPWPKYGCDELLAFTVTSIVSVLTLLLTELVIVNDVFWKWFGIVQLELKLRIRIFNNWI